MLIINFKLTLIINLTLTLLEKEASSDGVATKVRWRRTGDTHGGLDTIPIDWEAM